MVDLSGGQILLVATVALQHFDLVTVGIDHEEKPGKQRAVSVEVDDISRVEDSIINSLMNPLRITLLDRSKGIQQNKPVNPQAYSEYLKGRYLSYGSTQEESEKALSHFREAIRIDPKYAAAYAAIANEKIVQSLFSTASQKEIINEARTAIEAAKALDPNLPEIYTS